MTAQTDEDRLKHFENVKPTYTGLMLNPNQRVMAREAWWYGNEAAMERQEIKTHVLHCRACMEVSTSPAGIDVRQVLVDYYDDPLGVVDAYAETHCPHCGNNVIYAVRKAWASVGVDLRVFREQMARHQEEMYRSQKQSMSGLFQQAAMQAQQGAMIGAGYPQAGQVIPMQPPPQPPPQSLLQKMYERIK